VLTGVTSRRELDASNVLVEHVLPSVADLADRFPDGRQAG
jgi:hypothetical protein